MRDVVGIVEQAGVMAASRDIAAKIVVDDFVVLVDGNFHDALEADGAAGIAGQRPDIGLLRRRLRVAGTTELVEHFLRRVVFKRAELRVDDEAVS